MSKKNDGGPAFPLPTIDEDDEYYEQVGMSLRDWFAGQALIACLSHDTRRLVDVGKEHGTDGVQVAAQISYEFADAMLAERAKEDVS